MVLSVLKYMRNICIMNCVATTAEVLISCSISERIHISTLGLEGYQVRSLISERITCRMGIKESIRGILFVNTCEKPHQVFCR